MLYPQRTHTIETRAKVKKTLDMAFKTLVGRTRPP